ncbi:hypothetical protein SNE40_004106 [Patella caerulea]|uniref:Flavin-containing monooxygenase n=1 Tax=Patella caerulea TaxID=87958 RepID=A0AAN8KCL6_PATCE
MSDLRKRVCIIGAGPSGLACLRYLTESPECFTVQAYEQGAESAGCWVYTDETGRDKNGFRIHSTIYDSLKVNLPKEIMAYLDFPFDEKLPSFFSHKEVLRYLNRYADNFQLKQHIQFKTRVVKVKAKHVGDGLWGTKWIVEVQPSNDLSATTEKREFDAVIVCNGHFVEPNIPEYEGFNEFKGLKIHGRDYRHAEKFKDKTILTVGSSFSGWEITLDVAPVAKYIYLSHWKEHKATKFPQNVELVTGVNKFTANGVILTDGRELTVDAVILNTGYKHSFPFLGPDCGIEMTKDNTVRPLYKHTIAIRNPSLLFMCIFDWVLPFICMSLQARFIKAILEETLKLPPEEEMIQAEEAELQRVLDRGWPKRYLHRLDEFQFEYFDDLTNQMQLKRLPPWVFKLAFYHLNYLFKDLEAAKMVNYEVIEPDGFKTTFD